MVSVRLRQGDECQSFDARRRGQAIVECRERDRLASLAQQVHGAGELHGVARAETVANEQPLGVGRQLRSEFHKNPGGQIPVQPFQRAITLGCRERAFAFAAGECGGDFDGG